MLTNLTMRIITLTLTGILSSVTMMTACHAHGIQSKAPLQKAPPHEPVIIENEDALVDAEFSLKINNIVVPYNVFSLFVLPEEMTELEIIYPQPDKQYELYENGVKVQKSEDLTWHWRAADEPGEQQLIIKSHDGDVSMTLNVFIMIPAEEVQGGRLKYYHIGPYPDESEVTDKDMYVEPDGFIEVTKANQEKLLSPGISS